MQTETMIKRVYGRLLNEYYDGSKNDDDRVGVVIEKEMYEALKEMFNNNGYEFEKDVDKESDDWTCQCLISIMTPDEDEQSDDCCLCGVYSNDWLSANPDDENDKSVNWYCQICKLSEMKSRTEYSKQTTFKTYPSFRLYYDHVLAREERKTPGADHPLYRLRKAISKMADDTYFVNVETLRQMTRNENTEKKYKFLPEYKVAFARRPNSSEMAEYEKTLVQIINM
uniref:Uncharacterized protein n=1 Tax=viral metagenome TaxID=1070528 RepID=A0A6C0JSG0_9ZZZZ